MKKSQKQNISIVWNVHFAIDEVMLFHDFSHISDNLCRCKWRKTKERKHFLHCIYFCTEIGEDLKSPELKLVMYNVSVWNFNVKACLTLSILF